MSEHIKTVTEINAIIINGEYYAAVRNDDDKYYKCEGCDFESTYGNCMLNCPCRSYYYPELKGNIKFKHIGRVDPTELQNAIKLNTKEEQS